MQVHPSVSVYLSDCLCICFSGLMIMGINAICILKIISYFCSYVLFLLQVVTDSASTSPELNGQCADRLNGLNGYSTLPMVPADMAKKRPAPKPPMTASQSVACGLHIRDFSDLSDSDPAGRQVGMLWASPYQSKPELACV